MTRSILGKVFPGAVLAVTGLFSACSDSPVAPVDSAPQTVRAPASIEASAGAAQTALAGQPVAVPPAVVVKDALGAPMAGVTVVFTVSAGAGSLEYGTGFTDAQGIAAAGRWTLGRTPGPNEVTATAGTLPVVRFTAIAAAPPPPVTST